MPRPITGFEPQQFKPLDEARDAASGYGPAPRGATEAIGPLNDAGNPDR